MNRFDNKMRNIHNQALAARSKLVAQANANRVVNAELKRMVKLGADRYAEHLKKDKELRRLMDKNKAATARSMGRLVETFNARLGAINRQMAKDRKNSEH